MKPVDQEFLHNEQTGVNGDCFRACLASILNLPISDVPHFMHDRPDATEFNLRVSRWLGARGLFSITIPAWDMDTWRAGSGIESDVYHLIAGPSPRFPKELHSVVGKNGKVVFDPHADRTGLPEDTRDKWEFTFICKLCGDVQ